jgi:uncharacterized protein (DUF169 family)
LYVRPVTIWADLADRLTVAMHLAVAPVAITFRDVVDRGVAPFDGVVAEPAPDGRTGRVPAGCVFWMHAATRTFSTVPDDHANCSVGSVTHGLLDLEVATARSDVAALVESGWVTSAVFGAIPVVSSRAASIVYGPLSEAITEPDVVLLRTTARGVMTIGDALPDLVIEGKPQCHIVAIAKEFQRPAASVGCALSRARTGMAVTEMTCALPGGRLASIVEAVERAAATDATVARYAAVDATRFTAAPGRM